MLTKKIIKDRAEDMALGYYITSDYNNLSYKQVISRLNNCDFEKHDFDFWEPFENWDWRAMANLIDDMRDDKIRELTKIAKAQKIIAKALNDAESLVEIMGTDTHTKKVLKNIQKAFDAMGAM